MSDPIVADDRRVVQSINESSCDRPGRYTPAEARTLLAIGLEPDDDGPIPLYPAELPDLDTPIRTVEVEEPAAAFAA